MTIKQFAELPDDEQQDFTAACAKRELLPADFRVHVEEHYPVRDVGHIHRMAHVQRIGRESGFKFPAGSGTNWTFAFEEHLIGGAFD